MRFVDPLRSGEDRRAQLEQRHALPRDVLAALDQQLGRPRRDPHLHAAAVRRFDDLQQPLLGQAAVRDEKLVERLAREHRLDVGTGIDLADELVVDAAARVAPIESRRCARGAASPTSTTFRRTPIARSRSPVSSRSSRGRSRSGRRRRPG